MAYSRRKANESGDQFAVGEILGTHKLLHSFMKQVRVLPVVEAVLQFIQVGVQVFCGYFVVSPDDRTLQKAPHALYCVSVNLSIHPFLDRVIDGLVNRFLVSDPPVGREGFWCRQRRGLAIMGYGASQN